MYKSIDKKWKMALHVYRSDGRVALLWEVGYQCCKPLVRGYKRLAWRWLQWRKQSSFPVLGDRLAVLPHDKGVSIELAVHGTHEPRTSRLLGSCLQPGMTVIDIGANIGYFALLEARRVGRSGKVIAIEPVPENARLFLHNVKVNGYSNVVFQEIAISNCNGTLPLHLSECSNRHSLSSAPGRIRDLMVRVCTLDALLATQALTSIDLVRMDLEGHELEVLEGMRETIERYSPRLLIELHPHIVGPDAMVGYLRELKNLGYAPEWLLDQERDLPWRWLLLKPEKPGMDELISDWRINVHPRALSVLFKREEVELIHGDDFATNVSAADYQYR